MAHLISKFICKTILTIALTSLLLLPVFAKAGVGDGGTLTTTTRTSGQQKFTATDPNGVDKIIVETKGGTTYTLGSTGGTVSGLTAADYPLKVYVYDNKAKPREINRFDNVGEVGATYDPPDAEYEEAVGGIVVSVDKFGLLAPYIGLASTMLVATVATAIYVKRVKRRKEKQ